MGGASAPLFFSFAEPPHPRPGVAPAPAPYLRAVRAARPGRMARPAVPARGYRPSACPLRRHENCPACPGRPPPGSGPRWLVVVGAWWCGAGPAVGRRRSAPVSFRRRPTRGGRSPPGQAQGSPGGCNWLAGGPPAPRRQGWARPPFRGPRCGPLWPGPVPPPFRPALLRSRRATVEEGSALPGARGFGFRRLRAAGNGRGHKCPRMVDCKRKTPLMGFFRNYLPFRWRKISGFFDSLLPVDIFNSG